MEAATLAGLIEATTDAVRTVELPPDPFERRELADAALRLDSALLELVGRIHDQNKQAWDGWVDYGHRASLDPAGQPPPTQPPPTKPPGGGQQ